MIRKRYKNKRGVSIMVGYVLLISFAIAIGAIVFTQLKGFVPKEDLRCDEGVSLFIKEYTYDCPSEQLTLTLENTGRFSIGGYFIRAADSPSQEIPTIDLSDKITPNDLFLNPGVLFDLISSRKNSFDPSEEELHTFNLAGSGYGQLNSIEITPLRWQTIEGIERVVGCTEATIKETLSCT